MALHTSRVGDNRPGRQVLAGRAPRTAGHGNARHALAGGAGL